MRYLFTTCFLGLTFVAAAQPLLADSAFDFSGVQGQGGWTYRFYDRTNDLLPGYDHEVDAQLMTQYISDHDKWYAEDGRFWTMLGRVSAHGNGVLTSGGRLSVDHVAIRRWTSDYEGMARINGEIAKINFTGGNGVIAELRINGVVESSMWLFGQDFVGKSFSIDRYVRVGDAVEWWLDSNAADDNYDLSYYTGTVAAVPEPATLIALGAGVGSLMLRRRQRPRR
jgi:hypothetical protein